MFHSPALKVINRPSEASSSGTQKASTLSTLLLSPKAPFHIDSKATSGDVLNSSSKSEVNSRAPMMGARGQIRATTRRAVTTDLR
jgi:hypothetical protein